jgi:hypothetical protein
MRLRDSDPPVGMLWRFYSRTALAGRLIASRLHVGSLISWGGTVSDGVPVFLRLAGRMADVPFVRRLVAEMLDKSEGRSEQAGTEARFVGLHQPHPVQEKPGTGSPLSATACPGHPDPNLNTICCCSACVPRGERHG